ncbi:S-layer homology domain-containing protein [Solibacillus sp. A46]|uniref:S-layer homology domain-containing protein n=2 Tax=Solibacillus faecavium TaxID=2762221 RepID=A0ABR8Y245_9BACL|nr:S-layer homology domain-containing protein [Solibacillus faecavium]
MDRINRIDKSKYTEAQIKSIRMAYNALSDLAKSLVTNLHILIDAENYVIYQNTVVKQAKLDANAFDLHMDTVTRNSSTAEIAKARSLYNNLSAEAKRHVTTLEKLVRLETMWNDPQYIELVYTYYPDYVNAVKPGAIVVEKPKHDPLYIPDDSTQIPSSVATSVPKTASWSQYETMTYQNGRYTTQITSTQVKNIADRNMRLKAGDVDIVIPTSEIQSATAAMGVALNIVNNQLNIQFTEGNNVKNFSSYVEIHVPMSTLKGNTSQIIERVTTTGSSPASFKVDGSNFIIRTTSGGTFKVTTGDIRYTDIQNNTQGNAIRELAKRGITFNTTNRLVQSYKQVNKLDVMTMIASAMDLSSNSKSKYMDLENAQHLKHAQGLLEAGIMSGATSSRFSPTATVTKQEAAIIIANMYRYLNQDLSKVYNELTSNYRDIANLTLEARQSIAILELFGVVDGTGAFNPTQTLSRGEFAELFYKALSAIDYL